MKTFFTCHRYLKKILLIFLGSFCSFFVSGQVVPELVFQNPVLESGVNGQNGAKYRFSNVSTGLDAIVEIVSRSSAAVVINNIDKTGVGWDKALQPELGIPGTISSNQNWWAEFRIVFYKAGTNERKMISSFVITGLDIDGDGGSLNEWAEMKRMEKVTLSPATLLVPNLLSTVTDILDLNNNGIDYRITGPKSNFKDIDTSATTVMATYDYANKDEITFRLGGSTGSGSSSAGMRMNSLWFKQFDLSAHTLPVSLHSFTAALNKTKADLRWTTASEMNVSHFVVERSTDGKNYSDAALVFAYGTSTEKKDYSYSDDISNIRSGIIYYRLRMQDVDGSFSYSGVRMIRPGKQKEAATILVYPNPAIDELRVTIPSEWQTKELKFELFNGSGQRVHFRRVNYASQTEVINIKDLQRGVYVLTVTSDTQVASQKVLKN